ncbi:hypothetical protein SLA2020_041850 [Shorea laevis]
MRNAKNFPLVFVLLALASTLASAYDPSPLQDFCVGINNITDGVFVNGNSVRILRFAVTPVLEDQLPGLNTLGVPIVRLDYAPKGGLNPPHTHPRGTEVLTVLEGTLLVGFVSSNQDGNRLFTKVLYKGDVFVFPIGLIHFQLNIGDTPAVAIAGLSSHNPGVITILNSLFGSKPDISPDVLTKAFMLDKKVIQYLQSKF